MAESLSTSGVYFVIIIGVSIQVLSIYLFNILKWLDDKINVYD